MTPDEPPDEPPASTVAATAPVAAIAPIAPAALVAPVGPVEPVAPVAVIEPVVAPVEPVAPVAVIEPVVAPVEPVAVSVAAVAPAPPPVWPLAVAAPTALVLYVMASAVVTVVVAIVSRLSLEDLMSPAKLLAVPGLLTANLFAGEGVILFVALATPLLFRDAPRGLAERVGWRPSRFHLLDAVILLFAVLAVGHASQAAATMAGLWGGSLKDLDTAVRTFSPLALAVMLVPGALGAGLCEELLCRGLIQTRLTERFGPVLGIGAAALYFGLLHMDPLHSTFAFLLGVLIGWASWRTGSIVTGVVAHAVNNAISFLLSWAAIDVPGSGDWRGLVSGLLVLSLCVGALRFVWNRRAVGTQAQPGI